MATGELLSKITEFWKDYLDEVHIEDGDYVTIRVPSKLEWTAIEFAQEMLAELENHLISLTFRPCGAIEFILR